jgi:hypothetical protein
LPDEQATFTPQVTIVELATKALAKRGKGGWLEAA